MIFQWFGVCMGNMVYLVSAVSCLVRFGGFVLCVLASWMVCVLYVVRYFLVLWKGECLWNWKRHELTIVSFIHACAA